MRHSASHWKVPFGSVSETNGILSWLKGKKSIIWRLDFDVAVAIND